MFRYILIVFALLTQSFGGYANEKDPVKITELKTEYVDRPLGIDVDKPRFSWQMKTTNQGYYQTAYQIRVKDDKGIHVWNSGKVASGNSLGILYEGAALKLL